MRNSILIANVLTYPLSPSDANPPQLGRSKLSQNCDKHTRQKFSKNLRLWVHGNLQGESIRPFILLPVHKAFQTLKSQNAAEISSILYGSPNCDRYLKFMRLPSFAYFPRNPCHLSAPSQPSKRPYNWAAEEPEVGNT